MRKTMLTAMLVLGVALLSLPAFAHDPDDHHGGSTDVRQHGFEHGYRDGFHHGREDAARNAGYDYHSDDYDHADEGYGSYMGDRDAFRDGYRDGYRQGYDDGFYGRQGRFDQIYGRPGYDPDQPGRDHDDSYYRDHNYDYHDVAYDFGYRDGVDEGAKDRRTGHSYRPTQHSAWQDADHGLSSVHADKREYQAAYRQGYEAGYRDGYGNYRR